MKRIERVMEKDGMFLFQDHAVSEYGARNERPEAYFIYTKYGRFAGFSDYNLMYYIFLLYKTPGVVLELANKYWKKFYGLYNDDSIEFESRFTDDDYIVCERYKDVIEKFIPVLKNDDNDIRLVKDTDKNSKFIDVLVFPKIVPDNYKKTGVVLYRFKNTKIIKNMLTLIENGCSLNIVNLYLLRMDYRDYPRSPYKTFCVPKSDGSKRTINEPDEDLKAISVCINNELNNIIDSKLRKRESNQFAYIRNRGIKENALLHKDNKFLIKCDISKFFDNCGYYECIKYFQFLFGKNVPMSLKSEVCHDTKCLIFTNDNGLYTGNPISGSLSNLMMYKVSIFLKNIFEGYGWDYSIYADDITVSTNEMSEKFNKKFIEDTVKYAFNYFRLPFEIKCEKTIQQSKNKRKVTGIRINDKNEITPVRSDYMFMRTILEHIEHNKKISMDKGELQGKLNYYLYIDESGKFEKLINKHMHSLSAYGIYIPEKYRNKE